MVSTIWVEQRGWSFTQPWMSAQRSSRLPVGLQHPPRDHSPIAFGLSPTALPGLGIHVIAIVFLPLVVLSFRS